MTPRIFMEISEIRKKSEQELIDLINSERTTLREERFKDRFSKAPGRIKSAKQTVARALTELHQRANQTS